jgi:transcriptional regulator with XRE-family HTH domain
MKNKAHLEQDIQRIAKLLKAAVQFRGVSHREIERSMGLSTGYLSRIFSGKVELRVEHVLGVCSAIGLPPGAFFEAAYAPRELDRETARLVAALQELMPESEEARGAATARKTGPGRRPIPGASLKAHERTLSRAKVATQLLEALLAELDLPPLDRYEDEEA